MHQAPVVLSLRRVLVTLALVLCTILVIGLFSCRPSPPSDHTDGPNTSSAIQAVTAFQDGVSPSPSYAGTRDAPLAHDIDHRVNLGGLDQLETFFGDEETRRTLVQWDISSLPAGAAIQAAAVELYRYDGASDSPMDVALYRLTRAWDEGTGIEHFPDPVPIPDGATWISATLTVPWTTPGGDYDTSTDYGHGPNGIVDQIALPAGMGNGWIRLDATAVVQDWVDGTSPNHGLLLRPLNGPYTYHYYHSREAYTATLRPRLVVTYTTSSATPTPTPGVPPTPTPTPGSGATPSEEDFLPLITKHWPSPTTTPTGAPTQTPTPGPTGQPGSLDVTLTVSEASGLARSSEPVTSGVPIPASLNLTDLGALRLLDGADQPVPAQFIPLARWGGAPDDNGQAVRWLLLDFQADVPAGGSSSYHLVDSGGANPAYPTLNVTDGAGAVTVNTGAAQFSISKTDGALSAPHLAAPLVGQARDGGGTTYQTTGPVTVTIALQGPMRVSVHVQGSYRDGGGTALLDYTSRYWFYAGRPTVRLFHTVENNTPCPLDAYGQLQCHDIGSGGSVDLADLSLVLETDLSGSLSYQAGGQGTPAGGSLSDDLLLYQDSSGTDHWNTYPTLTDWYGNDLDTAPRMQTYVSFRGYQTTLGSSTVDSGDQAAGWLSLSGSDGAWTVGVRDFWQNFPKALRAAPDGRIEVGLFPDEFGPGSYAFNLRAGEHKTHEVILSPSTAVPQPALFARAPASWYVDSGALGPTALVNLTDWPDHENYVNSQLTTSPDYDPGSMDWYPNLPEAIEQTDFYGIYDYGDWPIDYEGYGVAPLNVKYDYDYGAWLQWARGGDPRWFGLAEAADRHAADIDILHNLHSPRHWGDGIAFGHSYHDEDGFLNPHRNYGGSHPDVAFGTPGMLLTYYLTGYEKAYESALELADCIEYRLHNDSHLCDFFPPGECSGEGYALEDADGLYNAGSRPAANNLMIAVAAYQATGDDRYLTVADALVDWAEASTQPFIGCPTIPGDERMLRPWMLNMYLRALAYYIEMRGEFGLPDTYGAQADFVAYANWLRTCPWIDLDPIDTGPRGAYPYEWWFDGRAENDQPEIVNWLLLGADAQAYAHYLGGDADYMERATRLFRAGSRDPWFEGDLNTYSFTKETANSVSWGHLFLWQWK